MLCRFYNPVFARIQRRPCGKRPLIQCVHAVGKMPAGKVDGTVSAVIQFDPVVPFAFDRVGCAYLADKHAFIIEKADRVGCFKSVCVFRARGRLCIVSERTVVAATDGDIIPLLRQQRNLIRAKPLDRRQIQAGILFPETKRSVNFSVLYFILSGKEHNEVLPCTERLIR